MPQNSQRLIRNNRKGVVELKKLNFIPDENDSVVDIYNKMERKTETSPYEARRTLEALQTVTKYPALIKIVAKNS